LTSPCYCLISLREDAELRALARRLQHPQTDRAPDEHGGGVCSHDARRPTHVPVHLEQVNMDSSPLPVADLLELEEATPDPRRASARWPVHSVVELLAPHQGRGVVLNVSGGGLRVALVREDGAPVLRTGEEFAARVRHADGTETVERLRVAWVREHADGVVLGASFAGR
jgi:hypothetical protein